MSRLGPVAGVFVGKAMQLVEEDGIRLGAGVAERHAGRLLLRFAANPATGKPSGACLMMMMAEPLPTVEVHS